MGFLLYILKQYSVFVNLSLNLFLVHIVCLLVDWKDFKLFTGELAVGSRVLSYDF